jgi:hypothetical protein
MASSWQHIDPGLEAVRPDHRGGTTAPLPRLWTRAAPLDAVIIHPGAQVTLERPLSLVLVFLSRWPCPPPCRPPARLSPFKIPACQRRDNFADGTTVGPTPPPPHQRIDNVLGAQGAISGQCQWIIVSRSHYDGSAGLCPCRHHHVAAIVIGLSLSTWAREEANGCHMSLGKEQGC